MGRLFVACLIIAGASIAAAGQSAMKRFEFSQTEMAIPIRIILYIDDIATAKTAAEAVFTRFHALNAVLSDYDPQSELRRLCDTSGEGKAVPVSDDLWRVLLCARQIAQNSEGAFDVTIGPVVKLWRNARRTKEIPSAKSLEAARSPVGYRLMRLDEASQTVELLKPNMRLDLGGIAKGYAVDEAMGILRKHGVECAMIDAGGNLGLGAAPPGRKGWRIGVAPPDTQSPPRFFLCLANTSVSTSGDLWQYAVIGGTRYSHIVDPRTGVPLTDHSSVTVVGPNGMIADALSSAVAVLGPEKGLELIESTPGYSAYIVQMIDGKEAISESQHWKDLTVLKCDH